MPKEYSSSARLELFKATAAIIQANAAGDPFFIEGEFKKLFSETVLKSVIEELRLDEVWAMPFEQGIRALKERLDISQSQVTTLIEVRAFEADPKRAAAIANKVAEVYIRQQQGRPQLVDSAKPALKPIRPNVSWNIFTGFLVGIWVSAVTGLLVLARSLTNRNLSNSEHWSRRP